jgi:hypothetical protein
VQAALVEVALCKEQEMAARAAREAAASASSAANEVGTSSVGASPGREASAEPLPDAPEGPVSLQMTPRKGIDCPVSPRLPGRGRPRVPRVTRSVTRAMLAIHKGSKGKAIK